MENKLEIESNKCVNSNWKARFLCTEHEECCQCSFGECKVRVAITYNGHKPYTYILTEDEIESAIQRKLKIKNKDNAANPPLNRREVKLLPVGGAAHRL